MTCVFTQKGIGTPVSWEEGVAMAAECQRNGDMDWEFGGDGVSISPATPEEVSLHFVAGELPHVAVLTGADGVIEARVTPNRKAAIGLLIKMVTERLESGQVFEQAYVKPR
jgi:hypothetical protein